MGWGGEGSGRNAQEGGDIGIPVAIHVDIWQKRTKFCRAIILQLKINLIIKKEYIGRLKPCGSQISSTVAIVLVNYMAGNCAFSKAWSVGQENTRVKENSYSVSPSPKGAACCFIFWPNFLYTLFPYPTV